MLNKYTLNKIHLVVGITLMMIFTFASCKKETVPVSEDPLKPIETSLDLFVSTLVNNPPTQVDISERVRDYLLAQPTSFFGSTVALLDSTGKVSYSPYWYRSNNTMEMKNLADTSYHIDSQAWLRDPIDGGKAIWTEPYFDAGGGEIWMRTRSVPVYVKGKIIAVATTDLAVE